MGKHNETGARGEQLAEEYLLSKGYRLLHRNWRHSHKEIDFIALDENILVFIEIKTRRGLGFGYPEESVTLAKQLHLQAAASAFMEAHSQYPIMRFDVLSIILKGDKVQELLHLVDAF